MDADERYGGSSPSRFSQLAKTGRERVKFLIGYGLDIWNDLSLVKRALVIAAAVFLAGVGTFMIIFHDAFFKMLVSFAHKWKEMPGGGLLMFSLIVIISFPPLIGYSALSSLVGMMYGFPWGWPFLTIATIVGSSLSFLTFRYLLKDYARRLANRNTKFAALTSTMEQDRFQLLWMIRLCPLPYSLSNGALSTIPSVNVWNFALATALTSPKLLMHIFIGDRIARLGTEKDTTAKIVDFVSIGIAGTVGTITAWVIYKRTMERARQLEQQGGAGSYANFDDHVLDEDDFEMTSEDEV